MWERYRVAEAQNAGAGKSKLDYDAAVRKMTGMVEDGTITREQMQKRLEQMKDRMGGSQNSKAPTRVEYTEAEKKMAAMVKAGEITREQMQQRLDRMKASPFYTLAPAERKRWHQTHPTHRPHICCARAGAACRLRCLPARASHRVPVLRMRSYRQDRHWLARA